MHFSMFICILVTAPIYSVYSSENVSLQGGINILKKCQEEFSVSDSKLMGIFGFTSVPSNDDIKCMIACWLKGTGFITDGKPNTEEMKKWHKVMYPKEKYQKIADENSEKCVEKSKSTNECDLALELVQCVLKLAAETRLPPPQLFY